MWMGDGIIDQRPAAAGIGLVCEARKAFGRRSAAHPSLTGRTSPARGASGGAQVDEAAARLLMARHHWV